MRLAVRMVGVEPWVRGGIFRGVRALRRCALLQRERTRRRLAAVRAGDGALPPFLPRRLLLERRDADVRAAALALADAVSNRERVGLALRCCVIKC